MQRQWQGSGSHLTSTIMAGWRGGIDAWTGRRAGGRAGEQTDRLVGGAGKADGQAGGQAGGRACRRACGQAGERAASGRTAECGRGRTDGGRTVDREELVDDLLSESTSSHLSRRVGLHLCGQDDRRAGKRTVGLGKWTD